MSSLHNQSGFSGAPEPRSDHIPAPASDEFLTSDLTYPRSADNGLEFELIPESEVLDPEAAQDAIALQHEHGKRVAALQIAEEHLDDLSRSPPQDVESLARAYLLLAGCYEKLGLHDSALPFREQADELMQSCNPAPSLRVAESLTALAQSYARNRRLSKAFEAFDRAEAVFHALMFDDNDVLAVRAESMLAFGEALNQGENHEEAERQIKTALREITAVVGFDTPLHQSGLLALGEVYLDQCNADAAAKVFDNVLAAAIRLESPPGAMHFFAHAGLAQAAHISDPQNLARIGEFAELAIRTFDVRDEIQRPVGALMHYFYACARGEPDGPELETAALLLQRAFVLGSSESSESRFFRTKVLEEMTAVYEELNQPQHERWAHDHLVALTTGQFGASSPEVLAVREDRFNFLLREGFWKEALPEAEVLANLAKAVHGPQSREHAQALRDWSYVCAKNKLFIEGEDLLKTARRIATATSDHLLEMEIFDDLAIQRLDQDDYAGAARAHVKAYLISKDAHGENHPVTLEAQVTAAQSLFVAEQPLRALKLARAAELAYEFQEDRTAQALARSIRGASNIALGKYQAGLAQVRTAERMIQRSEPDGPNVVVISRTRAMAEVTAAEFYGTREGRKNALAAVRRALEHAERLDGGISVRLELLDAAVNLCEDLSLERDAAIYRRQLSLLEGQP